MPAIFLVDKYTQIYKIFVFRHLNKFLVFLATKKRINKILKISILTNFKKSRISSLKKIYKLKQFRIFILQNKIHKNHYSEVLRNIINRSNF